MSRELADLAKSEWSLMEALWTRGQATASALQADLRGEQHIDDGHDRTDGDINAAAQDHDRLSGCQDDQRQKDAHIAVERVEFENIGLEE